MRTTNRYTFLGLILGAFLVGGLLQACTTTQRIDALTVATELDALNESWERADALVQTNADRLEDADRDQLLDAWQRLGTIKALMSSTSVEELVRHPMEVERLYWEARAAYSDMRRAVAPYVDQLHPQDRVFVSRVDRSAHRLDESAARLMEEAEGEAQVVLEMIGLATSTARLASRLLQ